MSLDKTPAANRLHIAFFGRRNSGKSSLINSITGQNTALVSPVAGTTTDPVYKAMELRGIGPVMFIDTAGFDDEGELGRMRVEKTEEAILKTDIAVMVIRTAKTDLEAAFIEKLKVKNIPVIVAVNADEATAHTVADSLNVTPIVVNAETGNNTGAITAAILRNMPKDFEAKSITGKLAGAGDVVMLVMPQDAEAPKGRLILPQVQTTRDLLDKNCIIISVTPDKMEEALGALKNPPALIITDSQVFSEVYEKKPKESRLTSFSVLFAAYKGDLDAFIAGAAAIDRLSEDSTVLIAEACTHAPVGEDIGRVKIPAMLRKKVGPGLKTEIVSGANFPKDLTKYSLIIHCGGCMFNRRHILSRIEKAKEAGVPITNYGIIIAYLKGILERISL